MGSPLFGHISLKGTNGHSSLDRLYGEAVVFSPDSRFVWLEELFETTPFFVQAHCGRIASGCKIYTVCTSAAGESYSNVVGERGRTV